MTEKKKHLMDPQNLELINEYYAILNPTRYETDNLLKSLPFEKLSIIMETVQDNETLVKICTCLDRICRFPDICASFWMSENTLPLVNRGCRSNYEALRSLVIHMLYKYLKYQPLDNPSYSKESMVMTLTNLALDSDLTISEPMQDVLLHTVTSNIFSLENVLTCIQQAIKDENIANHIKTHPALLLRLASLSPEGLKTVLASNLLADLPQQFFNLENTNDILCQLVVLEVLSSCIKFPEFVIWLQQTKILNHVWTCLCETTGNVLTPAYAQIIEESLKFATPSILEESEIHRLIKCFLRESLTKSSTDETLFLSSLGILSSILSSIYNTIFYQYIDLIELVVQKGISPQLSVPCRNSCIKALEIPLHNVENRTSLFPLYKDTILPKMIDMLCKKNVLVESREPLLRFVICIFESNPNGIDSYKQNVSLRNALCGKSLSASTAVLEKHLLKLII